MRKALDALRNQLGNEEEEINFEVLIDETLARQWESEQEFAKFFIEASLRMYEGLVNNEASLFDQEITYSFYPGTSVWNLWTKARELLATVERVSQESDCISEEMRARFNITSIFNIIPAILKASYETQSLGEFLANGFDEFTHKDNEFLCTFIALIDDEDLLLDIASNLRSSIVLDELVFCRPELVMAETVLVGGYGGLLQNRSLSSDALDCLSAILLEILFQLAFPVKPKET